MRQYQVVVDPEKLRAYGIALSRVSVAIRAANREVGGSVPEIAEAGTWCAPAAGPAGHRGPEQVPITVTDTGTPGANLRDIAGVQIGPEMCRVVADPTVKAKWPAVSWQCATAKTRSPPSTGSCQARATAAGPAARRRDHRDHDRSALIKRAVHNLQDKLIEEFIVVTLVCLVFLFHLRSAFVAIVTSCRSASWRRSS